MQICNLPFGHRRELHPKPPPLRLSFVNPQHFKRQKNLTKIWEVGGLTTWLLSTKSTFKLLLAAKGNRTFKIPSFQALFTVIPTYCLGRGFQLRVMDRIYQSFHFSGRILDYGVDRLKQLWGCLLHLFLTLASIFHQWPLIADISRTVKIHLESLEKHPHFMQPLWTASIFLAFMLSILHIGSRWMITVQVLQHSSVDIQVLFKVSLT